MLKFWTSSNLVAFQFEQSLDIPINSTEISFGTGIAFVRPMPRLPRDIKPMQDLHTIFRSVDNSFIFAAQEAKDLMIKTFKRMFFKHHSKIYAWVGMSNHQHIFNQAPPAPTEEILQSNPFKSEKYPQVGNMMRDCFSIFARHFNREVGRVGGVIRDRTTTVKVLTHHQALSLLVYIFLNPVRAGIVKHPRDFENHNFSMYARGKKNPKHHDIFSFHPAYIALGKTPKIRQAKFMHLIEKALKSWGLRKFSGMSATQGPGRGKRALHYEDFERFSYYWIPEKFQVGCGPPAPN